MKKQSRAEQLIELIKARLEEVETLLLLPPDVISDEAFENLRQEAIKLRDTLVILE